MGRGTGFGKTILIGDQFVLHGVPAVVSSISYETEAIVERIQGKGWILEDNRPEVPGYKESKRKQQVESIHRILQVMNIDVFKTPVKIIFGGTLIAGSGIGASAAGCVALVRALNEEFQLRLSIDEINRIAWEGEFAYHGRPSGVDNTASCYGGLMLYQVKGEEKIIQKIALKRPIEIVLGNSGISADTRLLSGLVGNEKAKNLQLFIQRLDMITEQSLQMKEHLEKNELEEVGKLLTENQKILIDMGLSHEKLDHLCNIAMGQGALGAKLTGGGMGGYMVALTPDISLQEKVAKAMEREGFFVIRTSIGNI